MSARRCGWCKRYVAVGTAETAWRAKVGRDSRQNPRSPWNYWCHLLCPSCAGSASLSLPWWKPTTVAEVKRRHASGWNPNRPYQTTERAS